jgi:hypothetical protein
MKKGKKENDKIFSFSSHNGVHKILKEFRT